MSNLSPETRALLSAARDALRPGQENRDRVSATLRAKLGDGALPAALSHHTPSTAPVGAHVSAWKIVTGLAVGAGVFGTILYVGIGLQRESQPTLPTPAVTVAVPPPTSVVPTVGSPAVASPVEKPVRDSPAPSTPRRSDRSDRLAQEVAILSRATRDLRSGRAADALKALDEHERRFPSGLLTEERRSARVQALCLLGRFTDADAELSVLSRSSPQSPNAARARQVCANRAAKGHGG